MTGLYGRLYCDNDVLSSSAHRFGIWWQPHLGVVYAIHAALLDIFRAGDEEAAVKALHEHLVDGQFNKDIHRRFHESRQTGD